MLKDHYACTSMWLEFRVEVLVKLVLWIRPKCHISVQLESDVSFRHGADNEIILIGNITVMSLNNIYVIHSYINMY